MNQQDLTAFLNNATIELPRTTTLLREDGLRTVLLHLNAGEQIPEHQTRGAITVHCMKGQSIFSSGDKRVELTAGLMISLAAGTPHSVSAQQDTFLLLTIAEPVPAQSSAN